MKNHMAAGWFYSGSQVTHYFKTRISSLTPPKVDKAFVFSFFKFLFLISYIIIDWAEGKLLEKIEKPIPSVERIITPSMAYVCCRLSGMDL
jgi:hypothetical protein